MAGVRGRYVVGWLGEWALVRARQERLDEMANQDRLKELIADAKEVRAAHYAPHTRGTLVRHHVQTPVCGRDRGAIHRASS